MKKQNGITLIALIITIIIMLILVGVTINVALNGKIFSTVDEATIKKEKNLIYEQIVGAMQLTSNGKIIVDETYGKVIDMYGTEKVTPINPGTVDENTKVVTFTVTGKKGTYTYKITEEEIKKDIINSEGDAPSGSVEEGIVGVYGSTQLVKDDASVGFEFKQNRTLDFYYMGVKNTGTYDENEKKLTFNMDGDSYTFSYEIYLKKDEQTGNLINKMVIIPDMPVAITTNGSTGFNILDGKTFVNGSRSVSFTEGKFIDSKGDENSYIVSNGMIYRGKEYDNVYWESHYEVNDTLDIITEDMGNDIGGISYELSK